MQHASSDQARTTWRRAIGIVLVMLVFGNAGGSMPVVATRSDTASLRVWVQVQRLGAARTLCVGDQVQFRVTVYKGTGVWAKMASVPGASVAASVAGSAGTISPDSILTSLRSSPPGTATFTYTGVAPGIDLLEVVGTVDAVQFLGLDVGGTTVRWRGRVQVVDCTFRISATSRWRVKGDAKIAIISKIELAGVSDDGNGRVSGTARVQWSVSAGSVGTCSGILPPESEATVTGVRFGAENITWDIEYAPAQAQISVDCRGAGGTLAITMQPDPLTFKLPAEGGAKSMAHVLRKPGGDGGTAGVLVRPVAIK